MQPWTAPVCSMCRSSWRLRLPETLRQCGGHPSSSGETLHLFLANPTAVLSRRDSMARPGSVRARRRPDAVVRTTRPKSSREETIWDALGRETPIRPARSLRLSHGQPESRSMARFSAGLSSAGRRYSGASSPGRYLSRSGGNEVRARGCSIGRTPPGGSLTMAASRSTAPLTEGSRHTGTSVAPDAASHSSARRAATGVRASSLRAYRSRISSGISIRTVPGSGT